jgi:hypothetical protein
MNPRVAAPRLAWVGGWGETRLRKNIRFVPWLLCQYVAACGSANVQTGDPASCPQTCSGCCDDNGQCFSPANTASACGAGGSTCQECGSEICWIGQCVDTSGWSVGPNGGTVPSLYFAVIGDTRPANLNDTANYPISIVTTIFQDIEAMNPQPQFVVTTGDYQYADPNGGEGQAQINLYLSAAANWTGGPIFSAMGNHECTGYTDSNCGSGAVTNNYVAWFDALVAPLGWSLPYYQIPIDAADGTWDAKVIVIACNAWDADQESWVQGQLSQPTTYTFVIRHEPPGAGSPCDATTDAMLASANYDLLIVGHDHQFADHSASGYVVVGNGGAPLSGEYDYGYVTIQQGASGFTVTDYDYASGMPVASFEIP